jgi:ribosomal protein S21
MICMSDVQDRPIRQGRDDGLRVQLRPDEGFEGLLGRFRRTVMNAGILREAKAHRYFVPKGEQLRMARKRAERKRAKRARREAARAARRP